MSQIKRKREKTIKSRLFISITVFSTILILVLMLSTGTILFRKFMQLQSDSASRQMNYINQQLSTYLSSVDNYSKAILVDSDIQQAVAAYNRAPGDFSGIDQIDIKQHISQIIQSIPYIHSVSIYSPDYTLIATTAVYAHPNSEIGSISRNHPIWYTGSQYSNLNRQAEIPVLSLLRPFYDRNTGNLLGYMDIAIPEQDIANIYKSHTSDENRIFFIDGSGIVQSSDGSVPVGSVYLNRELATAAAAEGFQIDGSLVLFAQPFAQLEWYLVNETNLSTFFQPTYMVLMVTLVVSLICILLSLAIAKRLSNTITSPLYHLIAHIQKVKEGVWAPVTNSYDDTDIEILFEEFNSMIQAQEQLKNDLLDSQKTKDQISLDLLQQQVNPHFLYNTLDNIYSLAELDEKDTLMKLVMNLSSFYRNSLSHGKFWIPLAEELNITRAYLQIMQVRYFGKFDFEIDCPDRLLSCICLKLLLQPIVENSIYHGIKELSGKGLIRITVTDEADSDTLLLTVEDNGVGISEKTIARLWEDDSNHFGVKNIHQRIQLNYGPECGLTIGHSPRGGCITEIRIKKRTGM